VLINLETAFAASSEVVKLLSARGRSWLPGDDILRALPRHTDMAAVDNWTIIAQTGDVKIHKRYINVNEYAIDQKVNALTKESTPNKI